MIKPNSSLSLLALLPVLGCSNQVAHLRVVPLPPVLELQEPQEEEAPAQTGIAEDPFGLQEEPLDFQEEEVQIEWFRAGYYAGAKFGKSVLDTNSRNLNDALMGRGYTTSTDLENDDSTFSVYGGYRFDEPFSVELAWVNLGQVESEISASPPNINVFLDDVADVHPFLGKGVNVKGIYHLLDRERVQLGVSLGVWFWNADVEAEAAGGQIAEIDESGVDLNYGIQALVPLGNGFSAAFAWERFMLDDNEADSIWVGFQGAL